MPPFKGLKKTLGNKHSKCVKQILPHTPSNIPYCKEVNSTAKDCRKIMGTPQPNTISVNGVEVPSWYYMWRKITEIKAEIGRLKSCIVLQSLVIMVLSIWLLLK